MPGIVYTIGHSNHSIEKLIELLSMHGVTAVADVRSHPYSRYCPHFNRDQLTTELKKTGLAYVFLGRELGARPEDPSCYDEDGKVQYNRIARTMLFQDGLARVARGVNLHRIALMCSEKDPLTCHRAILVCRHLATLGIDASHILENGRIETHDDALSRLIKLEFKQDELFRTRDQMIDDAYEQRGKKIAYTLQPSTEDTAGRITS